MRFNKLKNFLVPALLLAALVFIFGCGGGGGRSVSRPLTLDQRIENAKGQILEDEGDIEQLEGELNKTKEKVWTPPPGIAPPQSLQDSIDRVERLKKKVQKAKKRLQNDKKKLDDLKKEKEGTEGGGNGGSC